MEIDSSAEQVRHHRPRTLVRHVQIIDAGGSLEGFADQVADGAVAGGRERELASLALGHERRNRIDRRRARDDEHERHGAHECDRHDILGRIERHRLVEIGVDRQVGRLAHDDRVAVGRRLDDGLHADVAACTGTVVEDDRPAFGLADRGSDQP